MATLAAPGKYAVPTLPISTTYDVIGHQTTDLLLSPDQRRKILWEQDLLSVATPGAPGGAFGQRRGRRF